MQQLILGMLRDLILQSLNRNPPLRVRCELRILYIQAQYKERIKYLPVLDVMTVRYF